MTAKESASSWLTEIKILLLLVERTEKPSRERKSFFVLDLIKTQVLSEKIMKIYPLVWYPRLKQQDLKSQHQ